MAQSLEPELYNWIAVRAYQLVVPVVFIYLIFMLKKKGVRFFYDRNQAVKTDSEKSLISWSITVWTIVMLYMTDGYVNQAILDADMDYLVRRRLFYFTKMCFLTAFMICIYTLHRLRNISFSQSTRVVLYSSTCNITMFFAQFILRGYLENDILLAAYRQVSAIHYIVCCLAILYLPLRLFIADVKLRKRDY
ncbi:hypothetical protein N483_03715 [Pseudoalteromonas luteoviolacea NCIMB 1944]|uniref:Uncharacterized protein n=1 Tax=Pseudoalteromonas luteoviolacea (strain 2ta16) TaxID=1353533 RepID=V4HUS8_PSEL2|nr:hypothetical protein PL2TA16_00570 [Pseudoalteromonas luteoviolacea 2ta16]KZN32266.1 hypothetical protein N483_03715 [Pseudoalteromonas luteoviolacea NCIMB 1944]